MPDMPLTYATNPPEMPLNQCVICALCKRIQPRHVMWNPTALPFPRVGGCSSPPPRPPPHMRVTRAVPAGGHGGAACRILYLIISAVSAVLFTFFLIYDIQKLMGNRRRAYSPDDYIIASLNIYLDIVQIFLNLLQLIGAFANGS